MARRPNTDSLFNFDTVLEDLFGAFTPGKKVDKMVSTSPETTGMMKNYSTKEVTATETDLLIEVPGVQPNDLSLKVHLNKVIVSGSKDGKTFTNTYTMSSEFVLGSARAWLSNGLLTVRLQKSPVVEPKSITIKVL